VVETFKLRWERVDLSPVYDAFLQRLPPAGELCRANLKPRLRMTALYYYANKLNYMLAGTGNKSERMMGYFTKFGDGGAAFLLGTENVIAALDDSYSVSYDFPDYRRAESDKFVRGVEDRFIREEGYAKFIPEAISGLFAKAK
jgi:hypothetical protein